VPPAIDKIAGDRAPHDAKPDHSNRLVHEGSLLPARSDLPMAAARTLRN
jgi:hypothetical protein